MVYFNMDKVQIHSTIFLMSVQTGPVRLFTPYKRRRRRDREPSDGDPPSRKSKNDNSRDGSNNDESGDEVVIPDKEVAWPQFVSADGLVVQQTQEHNSVVHNVHHAENGLDDTFKKLDDTSNKLMKLACEFRRNLEEAKELCRQRREQALVAQLGARADVIETVGLQPASNSNNKKV